MRSRLTLLVICALLTPLARAQTRPASTQGFARWERAISDFEQKDRTSPPPKHGIEFTGASSIVRWKTLEQDYPDQPVFNRGFGGSQIADATHFADRIIFPYEPKMVFLRAGGNDLHAGKSVDQVFGDFKDFVAKVHGKLPDTQIVYISQSPAPARWSERDANKQANQLIEDFCKQTPGTKYVETYDLTITPDGKAREELFVADKLHFNADGYKLLAERVRPFLPKQ